MFYGDVRASKAIFQEKGHPLEWPGERLATNPYLLTRSTSHHF